MRKSRATLDPSQKKAFGKDLSAERGKRGWSQARLAAECGLALVTVQSLEQGVHGPSGLTLGRLARGLGLTLDYLFGILEKNAVGG